MEQQQGNMGYQGYYAYEQGTGQQGEEHDQRNYYHPQMNHPPPEIYGYHIDPHWGHHGPNQAMYG